MHQRNEFTSYLITSIGYYSYRKYTINIKLVFVIIYYSVNVGSYCGSLSSLKASVLGSIAIKECLMRVGLEGSDVSEVIMGQVLIILGEIKH